MSLKSWSSHLFREQPGHRLQRGPGRQPSDILKRHRKAWWAGMSFGSLADIQRLNCDDRQLDPARTEICQRGNVHVPLIVLPTDLG